MAPRHWGAAGGGGRCPGQTAPHAPLLPFPHGRPAAIFTRFSHSSFSALRRPFVLGLHAPRIFGAGCEIANITLDEACPFKTHDQSSLRAGAAGSPSIKQSITCHCDKARRHCLRSSPLVARPSPMGTEIFNPYSPLEHSPGTSPAAYPGSTVGVPPSPFISAPEVPSTHRNTHRTHSQPNAWLPLLQKNSFLRFRR